ncbi:MAG: polyphosphate kinase 1, partial [Vicinamibacterales bacterium]
MTRNLDKRIELMCPIEHPAHKAKVISALRSMFRDSVKSRRLDADGVYRRLQPTAAEPAVRVQQLLQDEAHRAARLAREAAGVSFRPEDSRI